MLKEYEEPWTVRELAKYWHCCPQTVYSAIRSNDLTAVHIGREYLIKDEDRLAYENKCKTNFNNVGKGLSIL